mgnify:FL=1
MENIEKCEVCTYEHKGYTLQQTSYNWHYMIIKDNRMVCHCPCTYKLTEEQAKEKIDLFIELLQKLEGGANG